MSKQPKSTPDPAWASLSCLFLPCGSKYNVDGAWVGHPFLLQGRAGDADSSALALGLYPLSDARPYQERKQDFRSLVYWCLWKQSHWSSPLDDSVRKHQWTARCPLYSHAGEVPTPEIQLCWPPAHRWMGLGSGWRNEEVSMVLVHTAFL